MIRRLRRLWIRWRLRRSKVTPWHLLIYRAENGCTMWKKCSGAVAAMYSQGHHVLTLADPLDVAGHLGDGTPEQETP